MFFLNYEADKYYIMDLIIIYRICILCFLLMMIVYKFILIILIMIEILILMISVLIYIIMRIINLEFYIIYYLVFSVCERVLGLIILVLVIRFYGNEIYYRINLLKFF